MQQAYIVFRQVLLIFVYIGIGVALTKAKMVSESVGRGMSNICLYIVTPSVVMLNFFRPFNAEEAKGLLLSALLSASFTALIVVVAVRVIKNRGGEDYRIERMAVVFPNCGFMAIPLVQAACGDIGVFYILGYICVFNIAVWSLGVMLLSDGKKPNYRKMLLSPGIIAASVGACAYLSQVPVPSLIREALGNIANLNTTLTMMTVGVFLAGVSIKKTFTNSRVYLVALLRLVVLPAALLLLLRMLGAGSWTATAPAVILSVIIAGSCPSAANVTMLPVAFGLRGNYGAEMIAATTLFSVLTLPLMTFVTGLLI